MKEELEALSFAYRDFKRRKRIYGRRSSLKKYFKRAGIIAFILILIWLIHDTIKFIIESNNV